MSETAKCICGHRKDQHERNVGACTCYGIAGWGPCTCGAFEREPTARATPNPKEASK